MSLAPLHRAVLSRLAFAATAVSLFLGAAIFSGELAKSESLMLSLAKRDAQAFPEHLKTLGELDSAHAGELSRRAQAFLGPNFVLVRVYDEAQRSLLEARVPDTERSRFDLERHFAAVSRSSAPHYDTHWRGLQPYIQVVLPIEREGKVAGFLEALYRIDPETARKAVADISRVLGVVFLAVLVTAAVLYPVIILLNKDLARKSAALLNSNVELMEVLGSAISKRDSDTHAHNYRVTSYAILLARALGLPRPQIRGLIAGAFLHDVGKVGVSDAILRKPGPLTGAEFAAMQEHVTMGADIVSRAHWLRSAGDVVEFHHERFDGSGYPKGLRGQAIPINARIFAIVDVFDALLSPRPYKGPMELGRALSVMRQTPGQFDARIFQTFAAMANDLYLRVGAKDDATVQASTRDLVRQYFAEDDANRMGEGEQARAGASDEAR